MLKRVRVLISGRVQGLGFRYWVKRKAEKLGLNGWVRNLNDGRVEAVFEGDKERIERLVERCKEGPSLSRVDKVGVKREEVEGLSGFDILK